MDLFLRQNLTRGTWPPPLLIMSDASKIKKLTQREHILQLPDTYIGSRDCQTESRWIYNPAEAKMEWREVQMNPGLFKIFDEIIVNALDHVTRQSLTESKVSNIRITLAPDHFTLSLIHISEPTRPY